MGRAYFQSEDIIVAAATPPGGALAMVRLSGPGCIEALASRFSRPEALARATGHTVTHGFVLDASGAPADEVTVSVYRAPKSFTGEEAAEIVCHGAAPCVDAVLSACESAGARAALPGEFSFRAFANGKMDLARAEAVGELARAKSSEARAEALSRLSGSLSAEIAEIRDAALGVLAAVEVRLDYGEDEIDGDLGDETAALGALRARLEAISASWKIGRLVEEGAVVAVAGRTNAGKSSLFNRILREERSIVSDIHGTTRDYIEAVFDLGGIPIRLFDTAGIRDSADPVEAEGVRRSRAVLEGADLVLFLADGSEGAASAEDALRDAAVPDGTPLVRAWTKTDLVGTALPPAGWIGVSSRTGAGFDDLHRAMLDALGAGGAERAGGTRIASERHKRLADAASRALGDSEAALGSGLPLDAVALDLRDALESLDAVLGLGVGDDVLETIFSKFCVGK